MNLFLNLKHFLGESLVEDLRKNTGRIKLILGNIHYDAREQDVKNFYYGIKFLSLNTISKGTFIVEFSDLDEAIKLINFKDNVL